MIRRALLITTALLTFMSTGMSTDKNPENNSAAVVKQQISIVHQEVLIVWHAKVEDDVKFYLIERKEGDNFEVFGLSMRNKHYNQYSTKEYQFFDEQPHNGTNTYRLVEVDFQDNKRYHEELTIEFSSIFEPAVVMSSSVPDEEVTEQNH